MPLLARVLEPPSYGWQLPDGTLARPTPQVLFGECFRRLNLLRTRKNWLALSNWMGTLALAPFLIVFVLQYLSWPLLLAGFVYGMVGMGTNGTIWLHRYGTHRAYTFRNRFWRFLTRNLVPKIVHEENYIISHHVHHAMTERPGDPYNALAGGLYCFLADTNHQVLARELSPADYERVCNLLRHTGMRLNSYAAYRRWGSVAHPFYASLHFILSWAFWYGAFYLLGGHALACALFGGAHLWAVGIRTFNYTGHGKGRDRRKQGVDFNTHDLSVNQYWPGLVAGEWHNNHHLYPKSARSGFLPHQIDVPWYYIRTLAFFGGVTSYRDCARLFYAQHYWRYAEKPGCESPSVATRGRQC